MLNKENSKLFGALECDVLRGKLTTEQAVVILEANGFNEEAIKEFKQGLTFNKE